MVPKPSAAVAAGEYRVLSDNGLGPDGALDDVGVDCDAASSSKRERAGRLGSGLIDQSQKMTVAAMHMAEKKVWAHRSYRVAMRRQSLSLAKRFPGKSKLAEAVRYAITRRQALERFIVDGQIEIDSNTVERAIRPQTIVRKNAIFAGSDGGGRTWATIATLLQTCRMNDVDSLAWLTQTLQRIADRWPISQLDQLMPWNFKS